MAAFNFRAVARGRSFARIASNLSRIFGGTTQLYGREGDSYIEEIVSEDIAIDGLTGNDGTENLFAANCEILGFGYEILETIVDATNFLIGDKVGADADRLFAAQTTYTAGTKAQAAGPAAPGAKHQGATADQVRITWTGTATAGSVRVWVHRRRYITYSSVD